MCGFRSLPDPIWYKRRNKIRSAIRGRLEERLYLELIQDDYNGSHLFSASFMLKYALFKASHFEEAVMAEQVKSADIGILGIAVMGENLAMNMEDHGFSVAVCNLRSDRVTPFMKRNAGKKFIGAHNLE